MSKNIVSSPKPMAIAITGGPCAGKTTFLVEARQRLEDRGFCVAVMPEVATEFILAGFSPADIHFQKHLLQYTLERERRYVSVLRDRRGEKPMVLLCDRGALDPIAYVGRDVYLRVIESTGHDLHTLRERYTAVIHLVTAADGAEEYYTLANNTARHESPELARELDKKTQAAWFGHQHLAIIDNSTDFERKVNRGFAALSRTLHMPVPYEIERKFRIENFRSDMIPDNAVKVEIVQRYLIESGPGGTERRVRGRTLDGATSYYYTEKRLTEEVGKRVEVEKQISRGQYEVLIREQDPQTSAVVKRRHSFSYEGRHFEIDVYRSPVEGLAILEVELQDISEEIKFPDGWDLTEVTNARAYANANIARGSLTRDNR